MKFMEVLTKLVVGMGKFGDYLLKQKVGGIVVAALAFACGAGLAYSLRREPRAEHAGPPPAVAAAPCPAAAPPSVAEAVRAEEDDWWHTPELDEWKSRHNGAPLPLDYESAANGSKLSDSKVVVLPSGRTLAAAGDTLYMLDARRRVVWKYTVTQWVNDFAYVAATGLVYGTAGDNHMFIIDAASGKVLVSEGRNGSAAYGAVLPYGDDACLVADDFSGYRVAHHGGEPVRDGVAAWRGTRMLWRVGVPPDAELQVAGSKIYAVTKTKTRILVREIKVPKAPR